MPTEGPKAPHAYAQRNMLTQGQTNDRRAGVPTYLCCLVRPPLDAWHRVSGPRHMPCHANHGSPLHAALAQPLANLMATVLGRGGGAA